MEKNEKNFEAQVLKLLAEAEECANELSKVVEKLPKIN